MDPPSYNEAVDETSPEDTTEIPQLRQPEPAYMVSTETQTTLSRGTRLILLPSVSQRLESPTKAEVRKEIQDALTKRDEDEACAEVCCCCCYCLVACLDVASTANK